MTVEEKLASLGLQLLDIDAQYRSNPSGAHFISHFAVPPSCTCLAPFR